MSERIYQVIIGVLVLAVLVGGWLMIASRRASTSTADSGMSSSTMQAATNTSGTDMNMSSGTGKKTTTTTASRNTVSASGDSVSVADQTAGRSVYVESVTVTKRGWVAVEDSKNWTLGAERVEAGTTKDVSVTLLRATQKGESYKVVLYVDNGNGVFDIHGDSLVTKGDGSALGSAFIAK